MKASAPGGTAIRTAKGESSPPSFGPNWDEAIAWGVDVTLILENLALTPSERLRQLQRVVDFHQKLREARRVGP